MVLYAAGNNYMLTKKYENKRRLALKDRTRYSDAELEKLGITATQGKGVTNDDNWIHDTQSCSPNNIINKKKYNWSRDELIDGWF